MLAFSLVPAGDNNNASRVPPFQFNIADISCMATEWLSWKASFEIFVVASGVTNDTQKCALLLHMGGGQLQKLFHTLPDTGDETDDAECVQALNKYFGMGGYKRWTTHGQPIDKRLESIFLFSS